MTVTWRHRQASWPTFDEAVAKADEIVMPVQVNGKLRGRLTVPAETPESELRERALPTRQCGRYRREDD